MKTNMQQETKLPKILICGSMFHYKAMMECSSWLNQHKIPTLVPENERAVAELSNKTSLEEKSYLSRKWLKNIKSSSTYGILVVNETKNGLANYIGANTFAEIVIAFNESKKIFLLNDMYPPLEDELLAWKAIALLGKLETLASIYENTIEEETNRQQTQEKKDLYKPQLLLPL